MVRRAVLFALLLFGAAFAQTYYCLDWTDGSYAGCPSATMRDISATGTEITALEDDDEHASLALPFTFRIYGADYTSCWVGTNGWIHFGVDPVSNYFTNSALPYAADNLGPMIAWNWDDMVATDGYVYTLSTTDSFFITFYDIRRYSASSFFDIQIVLVNPTVSAAPGGNGNIVIKYNNLEVPAAPTSATVGIESGDELSGLTYVYNGTYATASASFPDGAATLTTTPCAVLFTTTVPTILPSGTVGGTVLLDGAADHSGTTITLTGPATYNVTTTATGAYNIPTVVTGHYTVHVAHGPYWTTYDTEIDVTLGGTLTVNATLYPTVMIDHFASDFETDGLLTAAPTTGWEWGVPGPAGTGPAATHTPTHCWGTNIDGTYSSSVLWYLYAGPFDFTGYDQVYMSFWHWYQLEEEFDGGQIVYSLDGGTTWTVFVPSGGYDAVILTGWGNPIEGQATYTGTTATTMSWREVADQDLSAIVGGHSNVLIGFRMGSDGSGAYSGWYIDDLRIYSPTDEYGTVHGHVTLEGTADYSGVTVTAVGPITVTRTTDAAGFYTMNLIPGTYTITASKAPVWLPTVHTVTVNDGSDITRDFYLERVPVGTVVGYIDIVPVAGPDAGVPCQLLSVPATIPGGVTDAAGKYVFNDVPVGTYITFANPAGYVPGASATYDVPEGDTVFVDTIYITTTAPFFDFETGGSGFVATPAVDGWEWGVPSGTDPTPAPAHSPTHCWGTVIDGYYPALADWTLTYNVTGLGYTGFSFWHWYDLEGGFDGGNINISTDGGTTWQIITTANGYDATISTTFSSPIGGQPAFSGTTTAWVYDEVDFTAVGAPVTHVRFRLGTDSSINYAGWYVDDVSFFSPAAEAAYPKGCVRGYVFEEGTYMPIPNATVRAGDAFTTTSATGAFILCGVDAGIIDLAGTALGYAPNTVSTLIGNADTTGPVYLPLRRLEVSPITTGVGFVGELGSDAVDTEYITICNPNDDTLVITVGLEGAVAKGAVAGTDGYLVGSKLKSYTPAELRELRALKGAPEVSNPNALSTGRSVYRALATKAAGDVVDSFNCVGPGTCWGMGTMTFGEVVRYFVGEVGIENQNVYYGPSGNRLGYYTTPWAGGWNADMTFDGQYVWQVDVGGDNAIHKLNPNTGEELGVISDPDAYWDGISQRGLGYDAARDVFYVGGWNDNVIYEIKGELWDNPGEILRAWGAPSCAGIAFNNTRRTVVFITNAATNEIIEFNPETGTIANYFEIGWLPSYDFGGCEFDAEGKLWFVSMNYERAYALDWQIGAYPVGIAVYPSELAIPPHECAEVAIVTSGNNLAGEYDFDLTVFFGPDVIYTIPVQLSIGKTLAQGWNLLAVPFACAPNNVVMQLDDDIVPFHNEPGNTNIYAWDPTRGIYVIPTGFERGKGYYVKSWTPGIVADFSGVPYYGDFTQTLPYYAASTNPGWNLVGNPINEPIDWDYIVDDPIFAGIMPTYYTTGGASYTPGFPAGADQLINPLEGFFVMLNPGATGTLPVRRNHGLAAFAREVEVVEATTSTPEFTSRLCVASDGNNDEWNYFGIRETATDAFDAGWDALVPPMMGVNNYGNFSITGATLTRDIKGMITDGAYKMWTFNVSGVTNGRSVTVSWPMDHTPSSSDAAQGINQIYSGYRLELVDGSNHIDMRTNSSYTFTYRGTRTLYIMAYYTYLDVEERKLPEKITLLGNTPNPFNAATEISFALPNAENVTLDIVDVSGRIVKTLTDGKLEAGSHSIVWDGTNSTGSVVSSGIYFYRLTAGDTVINRKMTLVK